MPFRVLPNGSIECDTIEEALSVRKALGADQVNGIDEDQDQDGGDAESASYDHFWDDLDDNGKQMLRILADANGHPVITDELASQLGIAAKDLPKKLIHVRKMGERYGITPVKSKKKTVRGKFRSLYSIPKNVSIALRERLSHVSAR
jgi:hypothetical protein